MDEETKKAKEECFKREGNIDVTQEAVVGIIQGAFVGAFAGPQAAIAGAAVNGAYKATDAMIENHKPVKECINEVHQQFLQKQEDNKKQVAPQQTAPQTPPPTPVQQPQQQQKPPMVIARRLQQGDRGYVGGNFNFNGRMARGGLSYRF